MREISMGHETNSEKEAITNTTDGRFLIIWTEGPETGKELLNMKCGYK